MLTVITGAPCSGKTTYMHQHAMPGDVQIDFDTIAQALGAPAPHGHAGHLWHVTLAARNSAITQAIQQHHRGARVWIVDCVITRGRRQQYEKNNARIITLTEDRAVLHARATAGRPSDWHALIDEWLANDGKPPERDPAPATRTRW
jgi:PDZ domain-containing secreted protein